MRTRFLFYSSIGWESVNSKTSYCMHAKTSYCMHATKQDIARYASHEEKVPPEKEATLPLFPVKTVQFSLLKNGKSL